MFITNVSFEHYIHLHNFRSKDVKNILEQTNLQNDTL